MHIQLEKHSGGQKGDIQRHTFRRTEKQSYIYSQRNIEANGRETYRDRHSDGQKGRHTYTIIETFRRTEGRHTETHIQTDRRTDIHIQSEKHPADRRETYRQTHIQTERNKDGQTYGYTDRHVCSLTYLRRTEHYS